MLKTIAIIIAVLIAAVLLYATTKPDTFSVTRSASIKAPPEKIFAVINDFAFISNSTTSSPLITVKRLSMADSSTPLCFIQAPQTNT